MTVRKLKDDIYAVGAIDWDRLLFDELIPLPDGTSYNSYIIVGSEKVALIDSAESELADEFFANIAQLNLKKIDYVVANHAEQDHSGSIDEVIRRYPDAVVVTNKKCKGFLEELMDIPEEKFKLIEDGEKLSLGNKTLEFIFAPWVHWPETMLTYLHEDRVLFPCDLFGSHQATSDLFVTDEATTFFSAKRYFAQIMMPFRSNIIKHMDRLSNYQIDIIAPSHGPVYDKPEFIMGAYKEWISEDVKNEVVIPYVSMHGSTAKMVKHLINELMDRNITVKPYNLPKADLGELAMDIVDTATVVFATPTVLMGPHPAAVYAAYLVNALRPKTKFVSVIGSFGWGGKTVDTIKSLIPNIKAEYIEPVIVKGDPCKVDLDAVEKLADAILEKHKSLNII